MKRLAPLSVVAGMLACFVLASPAHAASTMSGILGKLGAATHTARHVEKAHWRRAWRRRCFRHCMWQTDSPSYCTRSCYRRGWGWGRHDKVVPDRAYRPFK